MSLKYIFFVRVSLFLLFVNFKNHNYTIKLSNPVKTLCLIKLGLHKRRGLTFVAHDGYVVLTSANHRICRRTNRRTSKLLKTCKYYIALRSYFSLI